MVLKKGRELEKAKRRKVQTKKIMNTIIGRRKAFFNAVRDGPIYGCVCCHRIRFRSGVVMYDRDLKTRISQKYSKIIKIAIGVPKKDLMVQNNFYLCLDCKNKLTKGTLPALSHKNNLELIDLSNKEELHLTELENCLIAPNILFQKFVQLPKSRWTATKDQIVNIPVFEKDILNTIESFPRTLNEAGIIPVKLKRKKEYKNSHL